MRLSKNFTLSELTASQTATRLGIKNSPTKAEVRNLKELAAWLQKLRDHVSDEAGKDTPVIINSGFRSKRLNKAIGGSSKSHHISGVAADIRAVGISAQDLFWIIRGMKDPAVDQCILEFDSWVHVSIGPKQKKRNQYLTATKKRNMFGSLRTHYEVVA